MSDMRRKIAMDRKVAKLEKVADTLTRLINALRDSESRRVSQLLNLIRSNASFDELQLFLEQQFSHYELESTPELRDIQSQLSQTTDLAPLGWRYLRVDRLADDPVYKVPAKPWTAVTDDSELVSHLVSLWLTWTYPWFNWLDADCLIKHMQEGKLNSRFCSPFLVNAILAEACVCVLARMIITPTTKKYLQCPATCSLEATNSSTRRVVCSRLEKTKATLPACPRSRGS